MPHVLTGMHAVEAYGAALNLGKESKGIVSSTSFPCYTPGDVTLGRFLTCIY